MATPVVTYLFTTFPKSTETFLQREIVAQRDAGLRVELYSLWGGKEQFRGLPVRLFPKWKLATLLWKLPLEAWRRPEVLGELLGGLVRRRPPSWINFWENLLGAGFACVHAAEFRARRPQWVHATWAGAPATAAWLLWRINGHRYSAAAHAYDIFEHGGDWWLREKLRSAAFVHTSTEMGRAALLALGLPASQVICIRRGLDRLGPPRRLRSPRVPLRLLCIARLVAKKGLDHQLRIYAALRDAGLPFTAKIVGAGPMRGALEALAGRLGVAALVTFAGELPHHEVLGELGEADVLLHTGVVAPSGDRDGLPNVIPEAMSAGVMVVTSPTAATTEAVTDGVSGLVCPVEDYATWVRALQRLAVDDALAERLRTAARAWVVENFDAHRNAAKLREAFAGAA